jgi:hypothetical protein
LNPETCRSKQATEQLSHPSPSRATYLPHLFSYLLYVYFVAPFRVKTIWYDPTDELFKMPTVAVIQDEFHEFHQKNSF